MANSRRGYGRRYFAGTLWAGALYAMSLPLAYQPHMPRPKWLLRRSEYWTEQTRRWARGWPYLLSVARVSPSPLYYASGQ